ncbi:MAG: hypothetical protein ACYDIC_07245 [Desulfobaccales bacterium]
MTGQAEFKVILTIDSQGNAKIEEVKKSLEEVGSGAQNAGTNFDSLAQAGSGLTGQLLGVMGVTLSVAGAFAIAEKAASSWYSIISSGIGTVDDYRKKVISTSYILSTMSEVKAPDLSNAYAQWKDYFDW